MKEGYKKTELGWIPNEWKCESLSQLIKNNYINEVLDGNHGALYPRNEEFIEAGVPYISANSINNNRIDFSKAKYLSEERANKFKKGIAHNGDVLFAHNATVGPTALLETNLNKVILSTSLTYYRVNNKYINNKYLMYYMSSQYFVKQYSRRMSQTTRNQVPIGVQKEFIHLIPPLKEQEKIAEILSTVDSQIDYTDELIEKTKELKKGLMQRLLTKGIGHSEFKKTEVGEIPIEWDVKKISDITEIISGGTPKTNVDDYWVNGDILWATPTDITRNKKYINNTEKKITKAGLENSSANLLPIGTVLMCSRATIGARCINTTPMSTNQGFKSFICKEELNNEFLYYYIDKLMDKMKSLASGSTFLEISKSVLGNLYIPVPSIIEQKQIADILSSVDKQIDEYDNQKAKLEELKKGLMQQLLTGKIRVV